MDGNKKANYSDYSSFCDGLACNYNNIIIIANITSHSQLKKGNHCYGIGNTAMLNHKLSNT